MCCSLEKLWEKAGDGVCFLPVCGASIAVLHIGASPRKGEEKRPGRSLRSELLKNHRASIELRETQTMAGSHGRRAR